MLFPQPYLQILQSLSICFSALLIYITYLGAGLVLMSSVLTLVFSFLSLAFSIFKFYLGRNYPDKKIWGVVRKNFVLF